MENRIKDKIKFELSVGEVAKRSGVAISAIHFYEEKGLIFSRRNYQNQRIFPRSVLRRIGIIKAAQTLGISLAEIQEAFKNLPEGNCETANHWKNLSEKWQKDLDKKIERLQQLRNQLNFCIGCGCLSLSDCRLRNPLDKLSEKGAGAILLK